MLLGTQRRGGNPELNPRIFEVAPTPIPTVDDFQFLSIGPSDTAKESGRPVWERRYRRPDAGHGARFQYPDRFLKHAVLASCDEHLA